jgi:hypothetical protein
MDIKALSDTVGKWLRDEGEVLAVARYSRAAGSRDYALFSDHGAFMRWLDGLPPDTDVLALRDYDLPLRGPASASMVSALPSPGDDGAWLVIVGETKYSNDSCESAEEVLDLLKDHASQSIAIGPLPNWNRADDEALISAIVPRPDGSVEPGVY